MNRQGIIIIVANAIPKLLNSRTVGIKFEAFINYVYSHS